MPQCVQAGGQAGHVWGRAPRQGRQGRHGMENSCVGGGAGGISKAGVSHTIKMSPDR